MLGDSKEKIAAESNLLDVLWSYCMMERAAGCVPYVNFLSCCGSTCMINRATSVCALFC